MDQRFLQAVQPLLRLSARVMAGMDLVSGRIHRMMVDRHRSCEFVAFLQQIDAHYPPR